MADKMDNIKQIQEYIIIDNFRKHYPQFPKGKLIKSESPDFILKTGAKHTIGIELTSLPYSKYSLGKEDNEDFISDMVHSISKKKKN
jgi:hypothetical protein